MAVFRFSKIFISYEQVDRFALAKYKFRKKEWQGSSAGTGLECVLVSPENKLLGTHWRLQPRTPRCSGQSQNRESVQSSSAVSALPLASFVTLNSSLNPEVRASYL